MQLPPGININALGEAEGDDFFTYLSDHRSDNGKPGTGYFAPVPQNDSAFSSDKEASYRAALKLPLETLGWRRAWAARSPSGQIIGHVDIRSHSLRFAEHRCLLGMGVHRDYRRLGLGTALLAHAINWASANTALEWLDLHVLANNEAAIRLYLRAGFTKAAEVPEMFKFDDRAFGDITMTKRLPQRAAPERQTGI